MKLMMKMHNQIVYGINSVNALIDKGQRKVNEIFVSADSNNPRLDEVIVKAKTNKIPIKKLSLINLNQQFPDIVHQGIIADAHPLPNYNEKDIDELLDKSKNPCLILILDGITDPHNLGATLRSADGAGVDFVIIPKDKNTFITPVVTKASSGATESIPLVRVTNLARVMENLKNKGIWIYGAAGEATKSLYNFDLTGPCAMVLGSEGQGMRRLTREKCDELFSLPQLGTVESLNVSVASGITLYEIVRQRLFLR